MYGANPNSINEKMECKIVERVFSYVLRFKEKRAELRKSKKIVPTSNYSEFKAALLNCAAQTLTRNEFQFTEAQHHSNKNPEIRFTIFSDDKDKVQIFIENIQNNCGLNADAWLENDAPTTFIYEFCTSCIKSRDYYTFDRFAEIVRNNCRISALKLSDEKLSPLPFICAFLKSRIRSRDYYTVCLHLCSEAEF